MQKFFNNTAGIVQLESEIRWNASYSEKFILGFIKFQWISHWGKDLLNNDRVSQIWFLGNANTEDI